GLGQGVVDTQGRGVPVPFASLDAHVRGRPLVRFELVREALQRVLDLAVRLVEGVAQDGPLRVVDLLEVEVGAALLVALGCWLAGEDSGRCSGRSLWLRLPAGGFGVALS